MPTPSYSEVSAIGVPFGLNKRWVTVDVSTATVANLYSTYRVLQLTLNVVGSTTPVYLLLSAVAATYATYGGTVAQMLASVGNNTLPTTTTPLLLNERGATFMDAFMAGYTVTAVTNTNGLAPNEPPTSLPDIRLSRSDINLDYNQFVNNALVSINGYYHYATTDGINGIQVKNAVSSLNISNQNQIGIWNFTKVGSITTYPITSAMVNTSVAQNPVVTLPVDTTNKYVFLILGGYPIFVDGQALTQQSGTAFSINFSLLNIVERFFESGNYLDLSSVITAAGITGYSGATITELTSNAAILAWLEMSQSYFVVVNNKEVFLQKQYIRRSGIPNRYTSYVDPIYPLVLVLGRHPSYWKVEEDHAWELTIYNNVVGNLLYEVVPTPTNLLTSGSNQPGMPGILQDAYLLQLGSDVS